MSSRDIWGHSGVFRVGLGAFGVVSVGFGVSDVIYEHLGPFCGIWGWFGGLFGVLSVGFGVSDVI